LPNIWPYLGKKISKLLCKHYRSKNTKKPLNRAKIKRHKIHGGGHIKVTFKDHSRNIKGSFKEHQRIIQGTSKEQSHEGDNLGHIFPEMIGLCQVNNMQ
jgi:hypothetical protein